MSSRASIAYCAFQTESRVPEGVCAPGRSSIGGSGSHFGLLREFCDPWLRRVEEYAFAQEAKPARPYIWRTNSTQARDHLQVTTGTGERPQVPGPSRRQSQLAPAEPGNHPRASRPGAQGRQARAPEAARQHRPQDRRPVAFSDEEMAERDSNWPPTGGHPDFCPQLSPGPAADDGTSMLFSRAGDRNDDPWTSLAQQRWPIVGCPPSRSSIGGPSLR